MLYEFQDLLRHQIQHHRIKLEKLQKKHGKLTKKYKSPERFGIILPESAHRIQCKLCKKEFYGQSRASVMKHLEREHEDRARNEETKNR